MIITNAKIITMTSEIIENGYIITEGEKIKEIGYMDDISDYDGEKIDALGLTLYPGFIDAHCHIGMWEDSLCFEGDDGNEETDPCTPHLRAIDSINPMDRCFSDAINAGVTTVCTGVGSANAIGGNFLAMKTAGSKRIDKLIIKSPIAIKFALGENPKSIYSDKNQTPNTRMATAAIIREQLMKTKRYAEEIDDYEKSRGTDDEYTMPEYDMKCEALLPLFSKKNKLQAHFHCHRADDIFTAIRLAEEFHLDYVLVHCTDGAVIADELVECDPKIICGPLFGDRSKPELHNHDISTPSILNKHKLDCAICTDHPETPIQYLPLTAALAVRGGMEHEKALSAITKTAAKIVGIYDRVGSLEKGKDADIIGFKGDPLSIYETPSLVMCSGKTMKNLLDV